MQKPYLAKNNFANNGQLPLPHTLHKTKGIVLRTVKYGETSVVTSVFTELFGLQSYLVNGVRNASRGGHHKSNFFQPAALLEMVVYHNELKQLQRIKEFKWAFPFQHIFSDVLKNGVAQYMVELLTKCLKQPEHNTDLFYFTEDCLLNLDGCTDPVLANFPAFFSVQLARFFGFMPPAQDPVIVQTEPLIFDLREGLFSNELPSHSFYLQKQYAGLMADLLRVQQTAELAGIQSHSDVRRHLLENMETYYGIHIQDFGRLKTLPVLKQIIQ